MHEKQKKKLHSPTRSLLAGSSPTPSHVELMWTEKSSLAPGGQHALIHTLPFQKVEVITPERASVVPLTGPARDRRKHPAGQESLNKLIWGDNLHVEASLRRSYLGKIDLIYIDPPFNIGADFSYKTKIGDGTEEVEKKASILEAKAYRDTWAGGLSSYLSMIAPRIALMRELLSPTGSFYIHLDPTVSHYVKVVADEIFGYKCFQREIIWRIGWLSGYKTKASNWIRNHDCILYYTKDEREFTFNKDYLPYADGYVRRDGKPPTGKGCPIEDVWNGNEVESALTGAESLDSIQIKSFDTEKTGYATQKNESILRRIIKASSNQGDLVADFFCGSGTTLVAAEQLGRRWIGCDLGKFAIHVSRKRLLDLAKKSANDPKSSGIAPFEILNIGKYERQHWHLQNFPGKVPAKEDVTEQYIDFILQLYGADPYRDRLFHGKKGEALVYVGSVDSPIQSADVQSAISRAAKLGGKELHVLGWDFQMGLNDPIIERGASKHRVKTRLLTIPREIMDYDDPRQEDIVFMDLAYLDAQCVTRKEINGHRVVEVSLKNFATSSANLLPEKLRSSIKKWSDYIDYWSIDWNFDGKCFFSQWQTFRTAKNRVLELTSVGHTDLPPVFGSIADLSFCC